MTLKDWQEEILKRENINDTISFNNNYLVLHNQKGVPFIKSD